MKITRQIKGDSLRAKINTLPSYKYINFYFKMSLNKMCKRVQHIYCQHFYLFESCHFDNYKHVYTHEKKKLRTINPVIKPLTYNLSYFQGILGHWWHRTYGDDQPIFGLTCSPLHKGEPMPYTFCIGRNQTGQPRGQRQNQT